MAINYKERTYFNGKDLALSVIGGRWKIAVIWCLIQESPLRLSEMQRKLPNVNQRMLIRQLRELEEDKIITRKVCSDKPPKVEYKLSDIGWRLEPVVKAICDWGDEFRIFVEEDENNPE